MVHISDQTTCVSLRRRGVFNCTGYAAVRDRGSSGDLADQTASGRITGTGSGRHISIYYEVFNYSTGAGLTEQSGVAAGDIQLEGNGMPVAVKGAFES